MVKMRSLTSKTNKKKTTSKAVPKQAPAPPTPIGAGLGLLDDNATASAVTTTATADPVVQATAIAIPVVQATANAVTTTAHVLQGWVVPNPEPVKAAPPPATVVPWEVAQMTTLKEEFLKQAAKRSPPKVEVNTLSTKEEYDLWKYQLSGVVALLGVGKVVSMVQDPQVTADALVRQTTTKEATAYVTLGAKVLGCLKDEALLLCCGRQAKTLTQVLKVLEEAFGRTQAVDRMAMVHQLYTERYDPHGETLDQWVSKKHSTAVRLGETFATPRTFSQNLMTVLLTLLPTSFDAVANALRASPPGTWQEVVSRLRDYDSATRQEKHEVQGHVYVSLQKEVKELKALLTKGGEKGSGGKGKSRPKKRCYRCGRTGHLQKDCYSKVATVQKVQKEKNVKGKGKRRS